MCGRYDSDPTTEGESIWGLPAFEIFLDESARDDI
jgi:hypothetical protein